MFGIFKKNKKISMRKNKVKQNITVNNFNDVRNTLREGDEGEDVKKLQNMLMGIGHICTNIPVLSLDGKYNNKTRTAVEIFQNMMGIDRTGIVDSITWERLKIIYNKKDEIKAVEKIEFTNIEK